jgi:hypothetical protein
MAVYWIAATAVVQLAALTLIRHRWVGRGVAATTLMLATGGLAYGAAGQRLQITQEDLWAVLLLFGFLAAQRLPSECGYLCRLARGFSALLSVSAVEVGEPIVKIVLLQLSFLLYLAWGSLASGERKDSLVLPVGIAVTSTLFQVAGVVFEAMFRLHMDNLALAKVSVAATVVGYGLRLGLPPTHLWYRNEVRQGREVSWLVALSVAVVALMTSFTQTSIAWATLGDLMRESLSTLALASAMLGFLSAMAAQGPQRVGMVALSLWSLPLVGLFMPSAHREPVVFALSTGTLIAGCAVTLSRGQLLPAILAYPVYPSVTGLVFIMLMAGLAPISAALTLLALVTFGLYGLSIGVPSNHIYRATSARGIVISSIVILGGLAFGWLIAWASGL